MTILITKAELGFDVTSNDGKTTKFSEGLCPDEVVGQIAFFLKDKFRDYSKSPQEEREFYQNKIQELKKEITNQTKENL